MKILLVASGKGGTGKSTTTAMLGRSMSRFCKVGLLDLDVTGPNLASMAGVDSHEGSFDEDHFYPMTVDGIEVFSPSFFIPDGVAVSWSGDRRKEIIHELLLNVKWRERDVLICDSPPGTGDEIVAVLDHAPRIDGAIIVTNATKAALDDALRLKGLFTSKRFNEKVRILGAIVNMETFRGSDGQYYPLLTEGLNVEEILDVPIISRIPFVKPVEASLFDNAAEIVAEMLGVVGAPPADAREGEVPAKEDSP